MSKVVILVLVIAKLSGHSEIKGEAELGGVINEGAQNSKNIPS